MSYASVSDMVTRFGEAELLRLAMTPAGELDDAAITVALQDASALIDGYLAGRYPLPLAHVPSALVPICADIARHRLYGEQAPEQIAKRYEAALAFLKSVGKGELALGLAAQLSAGNTVDGHLSAIGLLKTQQDAGEGGFS